VAKHYRDMLREVLAEHHGPTHVFYLDVPLEETLRRHRTRPLGAEVSADKFREWYVQSDTLPDAQWTICRLRISAGERRRRTAARGALLGYDDENIDWTVNAGIEDEAHLQSQTFPDYVLDTDGLDQREVVDLVLAKTGWPSPLD
jgi:hypothetical protein